MVARKFVPLYPHGEKEEEKDLIDEVLWSHERHVCLLVSLLLLLLQLQKGLTLLRDDLCGKNRRKGERERKRTGKQ